MYVKCKTVYGTVIHVNLSVVTVVSVDRYNGEAVWSVTVNNDELYLKEAFLQGAWVGCTEDALDRLMTHHDGQRVVRGSTNFSDYFHGDI